jgi:hypothetical protein
LLRLQEIIDYFFSLALALDDASQRPVLFINGIAELSFLLVSSGLTGLTHRQVTALGPGPCENAPIFRVITGPPQPTRLQSAVSVAQP